MLTHSRVFLYVVGFFMGRDLVKYMQYCSGCITLLIRLLRRNQFSFGCMHIFISDVLNSHVLKAIEESLWDTALFLDATHTAGRVAKMVKANRQGNREALEIKGTSRTIEEALKANDTFRVAATPKTFARILINRYEAGMYYGPHVDEAIINGIRTDLSFTQFLTPSESYDGGELVLCKPSGRLLFTRARKPA